MTQRATINFNENTNRCGKPITENLLAPIEAIDAKFGDITTLKRAAANPVKNNAGADSAAGATMTPIVTNLDSKVEDDAVVAVVLDKSGEAAPDNLSE
jgi:hypothetical protein